MRPPRIPPMVTGIVQTALSALEGVEFTELSACPFCGGDPQGYDMKVKQFCVLLEEEQERTIRVRIKRFYCRQCGRLCYADNPFYPDTRVGSAVIDLCSSLSKTIPYSRVARVLFAMGVVVDRTSCRNYALRDFGTIPTREVFGIYLPFSVLSLSALSGRAGEGSRIIGAEALAACGFPSAHRAASHFAVPLQKGDERDKQEHKEERQVQEPEQGGNHKRSGK